MSALLDFIVEHDDWEELLALKCVKVKHKDNLAIFNYELNMGIDLGINIDFLDPVVRECRGIIVDLDTNKIVCHPFDKFGNYTEYYADDIVIVRTMPQSYSTNGYLTNAIHKMEGFDQETPYHKHNLFVHSLKVVHQFTNSNIYMDLYDGALLHDLGKLTTKTYDDAVVAHYYNHENVGAYEYFIGRVYEEPYWDADDVLNNTFLVNYHMMPFNWKEPKTIEKYKKIFGEEKTEMLIFFNECDRI